MNPEMIPPPPAPLEVSLEEAVRMSLYERQHERQRYTWKILAEKARTNAWHGFTVRKLYPHRVTEEELRSVCGNVLRELSKR